MNKQGVSKMDNKVRYSQIFVKDIENGMVIARDVLDSSGGRLLAQGFEVKEAYNIRRLLNQHHVSFVSIIKEETEPARIKKSSDREFESEAEDKNSKLLRESVKEFNENRIIVKESFDRLMKGETVEQKDIEEAINNTLNIFQGKINVFQLMQSVKHLDDITYAHCQNVALVSYSIGQWLDLKIPDLQELALAGMLIDIGKSKVDHEILNKKGKLSNDEFIEVQKHSIHSYDIIKDYDFISERVKKAVLCHHERMDGSGYPLGLKGDKIPLFARIIGVADVYNALISHRPYRRKKTPFEAIKILESEYMDKLDTSILYLFLRRIASNYIGQGLILNNGEKGEIVFIPKHNLFRPIIKLKNTEQVLDLSKVDNEYLDIVEFS